jgi:hypothetical protein
MTHQQSDAVAARQQRLGHMTPQEPGRARYKDHRHPKSIDTRCVFVWTLNVERAII